MITMNWKRSLEKLCLLVLVFVVAITALTGCSQQTATKKDEQIQVTDLAGREVKIKAPANKVVLQWSGSGGGFITMLALAGKDAPQKIAGWDYGLRNFRFDMWKKYSEAMPELEKIPDVGNIDQDSFSVEKVISLKPDVLVLPLGLVKQSQDIVKKLETAGIPTVFIDYHTESIENHTKSILLMGKILGKEQQAQELATYHQEQVNKIYSRLKAINKPKPKVYVEVGSEGPATYGNTYGNSMWGALVEQCGGVNITKDKFEKWGQINPEFLLKANPDIIIITGSYWPKKPESMRLGFMSDTVESQKLLEAFTKRTGWSELNAVKNKQVSSIHHGISREVYDLVVIQYLAKRFYPEEFKDVDPLASFQEFHKKFLPVELSGIWMMELQN
ncbi:ABC transporter substrate-binding protein [Sporomusa sp.]|uniref:ABC transporter substrate-binding protein n=1 Tax=Sporomusa sp. TaxID=2078658 RepID=UPI002CB07118|nr:ABC transporter substrate-binding protein [Sporomusa sp.]HWR08743.1 ABC transporter substrate-binding protein [Sporomusa sp.]